MLLWLSAVLMTATAIIHAWLGEVKLIGPMLRARDGVLRHQLSRTIIRYAWHVTSLLMLASAATILWPGVPGGLVRMVGGVWLVLGLVSLVATRGRHVGWPVLTGAGIAALLGA